MALRALLAAHPSSDRRGRSVLRHTLKSMDAVGIAQKAMYLEIGAGSVEIVDVPQQRRKKRG